MTSKATSRSGVAAAAVLALSLATSAFAQEADKIDKSAKFDAAQIRLTAGAPLPSSQLPKAPANGEMAFVFSDLSPALYPGWDACPSGWAATNKEVYLSSVPVAEKTRLVRPENEPELTDKWKQYALGPNNTNVCTNYDKFPNRPLHTQVTNKIALGLNLDDDAADGSKSNYTCTHETFVSPLGEKGVDNQSYRAVGCTRTYRGPDGGNGEIIPAYQGILATGQFTVVMILRGVDSLVNDPEVEVIVASSDDRPIVEPNKKFTPAASFNVTTNPNWRHVMKGKIVDGVLITESADLVLRRGDAFGSREWDFQRAKLRLAFRADGTLEGLLGGYQKPIELMRPQISGGRGTAWIGGIDCAGDWNTLTKLADGARDPNTGQCTRISTAYRVTAAPAFAFDHPPQNTKSAATD